MWYQLKYNHPVVYDLLRHWPATVLLPCIFLVIAALAMITKWWDGHDAEQTREQSRRANLGNAPPA